MICFNVEKFTEVIEEAKPLLFRHWEEIAVNKDTVELRPDYDQYARLCESGVLKVITARKNGKMIGYSSWFVSNNLHYSQLVFAEVDIFFMDKEHRKGLLGYNLLKESCAILKTLGVTDVIVKDKIDHSLESVLKRLKFNAVETVYRGSI